MKELLNKLKGLHPLVYVIWGIVALMIYSLIFGGCQYKRGYEDALKGTKSDTVEKVKIEHDTVSVPKPVTEYQYIVKTKTDTFEIHDTLPNGNVVVEVPITQKVYSDSLYKAYVSGYKPSLDSIDIYRKTITIEKEITKTVAYKKKWTIGIQGGYGFGFKSKNFEPFVGLGINYRIF